MALAALLAVGIWYWFFYLPGGPREEAREAIARAGDRLAEAQTYPAEGRVEEVRTSARVALEEARSLFVKSQFDDARISAIRSGNLSQKAIDMARGESTSATEVRIYRMEGAVRVKRGGLLLGTGRAQHRPARRRPGEDRRIVERGDHLFQPAL